jgi:hypothetical protein
MAVTGKMGGGGIFNGGDHGDGFFFVNLILVVLDLWAAAIFSVHRVVCHWKGMEFGGWWMCDRSCWASGDQRWVYEPFL